MGKTVIKAIAILVFFLVIFNAIIYNAQNHSTKKNEVETKNELVKQETVVVVEKEDKKEIIVEEKTNLIKDNNYVAKINPVLAKKTEGKGFGPQSPRDISSVDGENKVIFSSAPKYTQMNLCNIHFHKNAEHKGEEFDLYAGSGDGHGYKSGYRYNGKFTASELIATNEEICPSKHGGLFSGDTIEVHYVHSTADVKPGATLGACLSDSVKNPQLRVETQVYVLVNDKNALDFNELTKHGVKDGYNQALNIPNNTGKAIEYAGSTTGPSYNEKGSPFQVTWNVRPKVAKVNIATVGQWCKGNAFEEDHAHGVRNLVVNPKLLSTIK